MSRVCFTPTFTMARSRQVGTAVPQWSRCCATNLRRSLFRSQMMSMEFFADIKSFRSHYGPGVDSSSNRNEYQKHFREVKVGGAWGWQTYHNAVPLSCNLGTLTSWKTLVLSRPVMGLLYILLFRRRKEITWENYQYENNREKYSIQNMLNV